MNKNSEKKPANVDEIFKNSFEHFQVPPPNMNWDKMEESLDSDFDQQFRSQLQPFQVRPQQKVWDNIQEELPLHPTARRYISWMTKVAAILVIGMLLSILSDQQQQEEIAAVNNNGEQTTRSFLPNRTEDSTSTFSEEDTNSAFVYEVKKSSASSKNSRKYSMEEEAEMKTLLQFILEDDEDLAGLVDAQVIEESLKPIEALEKEMALAKADIEAVEENIDLEIKIPLKVVETEQEAANLIQLYESSHKPSRLY